MKPAFLLATALVVSSAMGTGTCRKPPEHLEQLEQLEPQAVPVFTWLKAVKSGDKELLRTVFSMRIRSRFDELGWDPAMELYQRVFEEKLGEYQLEDFAFEFTGGDEEGAVAILHKGESGPEARVIKEDGSWKVDER